MSDRKDETASVSETILPQDQELNFTIQATDGDGDPTGTSTLTVEIDADAPPPAPLMANQETQGTASADMSATLVPSNDNTDTAKAFIAGNQAALMGVIAAAGLEMSGKIADVRAMVDEIRGDSAQVEGGNQAALVNVEDDGGQAAIVSVEAPSDAAVSHMADAGASNASAVVSRTALDSANDDAGPAVSALAAGTEASQAAEASAMTASAVAMPSMEMVAALEAASHGVAASDAASVAHNQEVGRVLAEALAGGNGPDIAALVDAIGGGKGGAEAALDALASIQAAAVSIGHSEGAWAFANGHGVFSMDSLAVHHDATPA